MFLKQLKYIIMKSKIVYKLSIFIYLFLWFSATFGQVKLPKLISDGMVLQRNANVKIWGWAAKDEKISISFHDSVYTTVANEKGDWEIHLKNLNAGGPYTMNIKASNSIEIKDIMIGEVWLCSGQSNMGTSYAKG